MAGAEQDYATVSGEQVHRSDFAYAPAGSEPHEWKLPIHDASHVRNALARFNQTQLPAAAKKAAWEKIMQAARKYGIQVGKEHGSEGRIAVVLTGEGAPVATPSDVVLRAAGTQLREIAVAVPGSWVKCEHSFSITKQDLADMVRNFEKRKNDMIVIDYEHASEQPEVAKGGPVPGAGWIHGLTLGSRQKAVGSSGDWGLPSGECLTALVEWTPQAEEMLRTGQYRFFSPAIDWGATDKETGEPQGATLTSGALTNHPFLEELPPIMLSDGTALSGASQLLDSELLTSKGKGRESRVESRKEKTMAEKEERERLEDPEEKLAEEEASDEEGDGETSAKHELPLLKIRKGRKGSKHEGHHIVSLAGGADVGCVSEEDLRQHAAKHLGVNPSEEEDAEQAEEKERASELRRRSLILSEVAKDGKIDSRRAIELADRGKITFADYIRAQEAEKLIDTAVREGKILPRHRAFFFADALTRPAEFAEYVKQAPQAVKLDTVGFGSAGRGTPDQEIDLGVKKLMRESKMDYAAAFKQFLAENPVLADQYRRQHSPRVNADGTAN
jgi:phage I-like protein